MEKQNLKEVEHQETRMLDKTLRNQRFLVCQKSQKFFSKPAGGF